MTTCHICRALRVREVEPAFGSLPAETEPDVWRVAMRNGLYVDACFECWFKWPDDHKRFPETGFGRPALALIEGGASSHRTRVVYNERGELIEFELLPPRDGPAPPLGNMDEFVQLLRERAP